MNDTSSVQSTATGSFAGQIAGQQPHAIDRELSTLLKDNYAVSDQRRGVVDTIPPAMPGSWSRMSDEDVRAAGIDPALMHDSKSGFDASFYRDAGGNVVLAFTGTDELKDWKHNLGQGLGFQDAQYDQAIALGREAKAAFGDQVIVSGHSLGGGLAAASAMVNEIPAVTFNAAGVNDNTLERYGFDASVLKQEAEQGLVRSYAVKNELLTHLQEDSIPLKYAMPDAPGHRIQLPDPDPQTFFERLVPGKMLKHRLDLHYIDAVMEAQDKAALEVRPYADTGNRLLGDAVDGLATQRRQLGLDDNEKFYNTAASVAARAGHDGLQQIDHLVATRAGDGVVAVQGGLHDPAQQRVHVAVEAASQVPARDSAEQLRTQATQPAPESPSQTQQRGIAMA